MKEKLIFILTTKHDQSIEFFVGPNVTIGFFEDDDQVLKDIFSGAQFDVIYVRDPFNGRNFQLQNIERKLQLVNAMQPSARYVDEVRTLEDVLFEDKWRQAQILGKFMPSTWLGGTVEFIERKHIAKKRISSRSRDIIFEKTPELNQDWIFQDILPIQEELRVYVLHGGVIQLASIKKSKQSTEKTKVISVRKLTASELQFVQQVVAYLPDIDFMGLDIALTESGLRLIEVNRSPQFKRYNELSGNDIVNNFFNAVREKNVMSDRVTLGHIETVGIPTLGINTVTAKVDTGAFSGALHCTNIQLSHDGSVLSFDAMGDPNLHTETTDFKELTVRSASGHESQRFRIQVDILIRGILYAATIGITDRSNMDREMLIGRRFLRQHNMTVDVTINGEHDEEWKRVNI